MCNRFLCSADSLGGVTAAVFNDEFSISAHVRSTPVESFAGTIFALGNSHLPTCSKDLLFTHMDEYESSFLDHTFSALAHPVRRRILGLLSSDDVCVTDLAANFDCSLNVVSKHIQSLERAGLIRRNRQGRVHRLHLEAAPLAEAAAFVNRYKERWERQFDRLSAHLDKLAEEEGRSRKKRSRR